MPCASRSQITALAVALLFAAPAWGAAPDPGTGLKWQRRGIDEAITVTATRSGARLSQAQADVGAIADRLDALRTVTRHVIWRSIEWTDGRVVVEARADSAVFANVALLAVRALFPGCTTAGSGVQQRRAPPGEIYGWRAVIKVLLAPPSPRAPQK